MKPTAKEVARFRALVRDLKRQGDVKISGGTKPA